MIGRVLVVGAGGLGSPVALALSAAGVPLTLVDDDVVSRSNLQRQLLFSDADVGRKKATAAAARLAGADVRAVDARLAAAHLPGHALVVDGTDNLPTRFLANDLAVAAGIPLVHGGVLGFRGQVLVAVPGQGACYRCLFEAEPPEGSVPSCSEAGVLGAVCGVVGGVMARAALALLRGDRADAGTLTVYEALPGKLRTVRIARDPKCAACGDGAAAGGDRARPEARA